MSEFDFDLISHNVPERYDKNKELRELIDHYWKAKEVLGNNFPMYRALERKLVGSEILPHTEVLSPDGFHKPKPATEVLNRMINESDHTLVSIAWQHAVLPWGNDPTLSWTTDLDHARMRAQNITNIKQTESAIIEATGQIMPFGISVYSDLKPNFAIHIPTLAEIRGSWPADECKEENEVITFGRFPMDKYEIIEEIK